MISIIVPAVGILTLFFAIWAVRLQRMSVGIQEFTTLPVIVANITAAERQYSRWGVPGHRSDLRVVAVVQVEGTLAIKNISGNLRLLTPNGKHDVQYSVICDEVLNEKSYHNEWIIENKSQWPWKTEGFEIVLEFTYTTFSKMKHHYSNHYRWDTSYQRLLGICASNTV